MEVKTIIQTMGSIAKVEDLKVLHTNILPNTMVMEESEPFPGYHGANLPTGKEPFWLFFLTQKPYSLERIIRTTQSIKKYFKLDFDATAGNICMYNDRFGCIRIRNLGRYELISELQACYRDEGIKLLKKKKIKGQAIIQIKKYFELEMLKEGLYKDLEDKNMFYLVISENLTWKHFKKITEHIKRNHPEWHFDAALGSVFFKEILDVVRIYSSDIDPDQLKMLRETYEKEIRKV